MHLQGNQQKSIIDWLSRGRFCISKLFMEHPNQKKIEINSVMRWSSKSIFSDTNQGRLWRTKVSVGTKQRSRSNRSSSIYKICFLFSAISLYIRRNNRLTFKQSYREVSYWGCQKKGLLYIDNLISGGENSE